MAFPTFTFDDAERRRTMDFAYRLRTVRYAALAALLPGGILAVLAYGPQLLIFVGAIIAAFAMIGLGLHKSKRPELQLLAALGFVQIALSGMIITGSQFNLDAMGLLILPAVGSCLLFPKRIMWPFVIYTALVMTATAFIVDPSGLRDMPPTLILPVGVMFCAVLPAAMIRQLDIESRDTAMIDSLTGALNRSALEARIAELSAQAHALPLRVGVIMGDLDRFKQVNDELGHDAGDAVLKETVRRIRAILGPLTPVYRVGGEEFAVLMAGADEPQVESVAERLRQAVREDAMLDRSVTMSFGIAAGTLDEYPVARVIEVADEALYRSKRGGRDRVSAANLRPMTVVPTGATAGAAPAPATAAAVESAITAPPRATPTSSGGAVALGHDNGNWLVRGEFERDHIRQSAKALAKTHHGALGFVFLALIVSIPWMGWHLMIPAVPAVIFYHAAERRIRRWKHPEYVLGAAWLSVQLGILGGAVIVDPGEPFMLILFTPMLIGMTAVFPSKGAHLGTSITVGLVALAALIARPDVFLSDPGLAVPPSLVVIGIALMASVTGRSAIEFRAKAVVDPLTGLLTRAALRSRLAEIGHESQVSGARVSVIAFDIDHFKAFNDTHGHATGDAVLRAVGTATRGQLHALEWGFRTGGDEFIVVVPTGQAEAARLAERLRSAIEQAEVDGVRITGSFGVASNAIGERFSFESVSRQADAALYEAKRAGRNRVAVAAASGQGPTPIATVLRGAA